MSDKPAEDPMPFGLAGLYIEFDYACGHRYAGTIAYQSSKPWAVKEYIDEMRKAVCQTCRSRH